MIDVFISYASQDRSVVEWIARQLEQEGYSVWWDQHIRTGRTYDREIEQALEAARVVLVLWSASAIDSEWVRSEATEGLEGDRLIPIRIEDVKPPLAFRRMQTIDLLGQTVEQTALTPIITAIANRIGTQPKLAPARPTGNKREITYLAGRISGLAEARRDADPEDAELYFEQLRSRLERTARLYGGTIQRSDSVRFNVLFGLPAAHEDDQTRAVHLGLALEQEVCAFEREQGDESSLSYQGAIDSGLVVARQDSEHGTDFQISGGCVNTAEQILEQCKGNDLLISDAVRKQVAPYFVLGGNAPVTLDGQPLDCFPVEGSSNIHTRIEAARISGFTPHRGRELELTLLQTSAAKALGGRGRLLFVSGDAGVGKSRLVDEFMQTSPSNSAQLLEGSCQAYGSRSPYLPFLEVLETLLLSGDTSLSEETRVAGNLTKIDPTLEQVIPLILHLLSIQPTAHQATQLEGLALRTALQEAVVATLTLAASQLPMALILEDWHWADQASDELLHRLLESCARYPLLVVVTARPGLNPSWLTHSNLTTVNLEPLAHEDIADFIEGLWDVEDLATGFVELVERTTGGNPFFIEEICRSLLDEGLVRIEGRRAVFDATIEQLDLPSSVQAVIRSRIDQLSPVALELLKAASVIGREFSMQTLQTVCRAGGELADVLNGLVESDLLQPTQLLPEPEYEFKHALTQVVAYESLLRPQRRDLHQRVGEAIEATARNNLEEEVELMAYHFTRSEDSHKAIEYTLRAGEKAASRSAAQAAAEHFSRASELIAHAEQAEDRDRQQLRALVNLGTALMVVKGYSEPEVISTFNDALKLSQRLPGKREQFATRWGLWRYYYNAARMGEARQAADDLMAVAADGGEPELLLAAHTALGVVALFEGHFDSAAASFEASSPFIGEGDTSGRAVAYGLAPDVMSLSFAGMTDIARGHISPAQDKLARACALASSIRHDATEAFANYYGAAMSLLEADIQGAAEYLAVLSRVAQRSGFPHWIALAGFQSALQRAARGEIEAAMPDILATKDRAVALGVGLLRPTCAVSLVPIRIALEQIEESFADLTDAQLAVDAGRLGYFAALLLRSRGLLLQASGDKDGARAAFSESVTQASALNQAQFRLRAMTDLAVLAPDQGTLDGLRRATAEADPRTHEASDYLRAMRTLSRADETGS